MDLLKELLIQLVSNDPLTNVFEQEQILVQSAGISQWLKIGIASEIGISANVKFPLPASFLWEMFNVALPELPKESAFSKEMMKWKIIKILPSVIDTPEFSSIKSYLDNDNNGTKLHQLADKIADLYDQYSVYRPEWISEWEKSEWDSNIVKGHTWQPILWKLLVNLTKDLGQSPMHRANMYELFIKKMNNGDFDKSLLPSRLFVVGISSLPPRFLDALEAISKHIEIHLMFANPSKYYWGDIKDRKTLAKIEAKRRKKISRNNNVNDSDFGLLVEKDIIPTLSHDDQTLTNSIGNSLLASMGKTGRDYLSLLSEKESYEIDVFVDIERDSLLHNIQADILNLEDRMDVVNVDSNEHKEHINQADQSIQFHGCFSPRREVEALHDHLLKSFNDDKTLKPQDVVVMVSDINQFSHHISAIFGGAPKDCYIPFSISDRTVSSESPVLQVFLDLLGIGMGRQEASSVIKILEVPAIMRKFDITSDELSKLSTWIEQSGIRWGLCPNTASHFNLPTPKHNHWLFGLNRMILGYSIPQEDGEFCDTISYNECQGSSAELAGKLGVFIDRLIELRDLLTSPQLINDWLTTINSVIDDFFNITKDEEEAILIIKTKVSELYRVVTNCGFNDTIGTDVLHRHFNNIFSKDRLSQHYMMGKVTFCTLMPMRSIPFSKVCLLGMNEGLYPKPSQPIGFDLMAANPIIGDRSRRNDDRYLFLEAILSAKKSLYLSFVDRDVQDNTKKNPSVLVSELLEYIEQCYCIDNKFCASTKDAETEITDNLFHQHPLNPFSPKLFTNENPSYASEWFLAAKATQSHTKNEVIPFLKSPLPNILFTESSSASIKLDIGELLRCWSLPVKHFFTRRLKVNFDIENQLSKDEELFDLNAKEAFPIKRQWLDLLVEEGNKEQLNQEKKDYIFKKITRKFELEGLLPHGGFAFTALKELRESIESLATLISEHTKEENIEHKIDIEVNVDEKLVTLGGWARQVYPNYAIYYRAGALRSQDIMQAWVQHLAICSHGLLIPTHIFCLKEQKTFSPIDKKMATTILQTLVKGYYSSMCYPLPFLPRCSQAALNVAFNNKTNSFSLFENDTDRIVNAITLAFNGGFGMSSGEGDNPYISRVWSEMNEGLAKEIYASALTYLEPAICSLKQFDQ